MAGQRAYLDLPETLTIRELAVQVQPRGFRVRRVLLVTTLTNAAKYPARNWRRPTGCGGMRRCASHTASIVTYFIRS